MILFLVPLLLAPLYDLLCSVSISALNLHRLGLGIFLQLGPMHHYGEPIEPPKKEY